MGPAADLRPDWRDDAPYRALAGIDRAGLAWEWLRRDPSYAAMATRLGRLGDVGGQSLVPEADARAFGLCFCRGSRAVGARGAAALACGPRSLCAGSARLADRGDGS
ncbi:transcriptional regulator domain-containing protein [Sphingomonas pituitosa]|uniref:transcriptional regulator domain-containing protein n=1 Tax=Sphingomonas pituitosa TaxID=99597 RepID=UPI003570AE0E